MSGIYLRQYGVGLDGTTAGSLKVRTKLRQAGRDAFAADSHWTPAAGDVTVSKDFGAEANIATLPSYVNGWWEFTLSASELTAKQTAVTIDDPAIVPEAFVVETFGDVNAMYSVDWSGANAHAITTNDRVTTALPDAAPGSMSGALPVLENVSVRNESGTNIIVRVTQGVGTYLARAVRAVTNNDAITQPRPGETDGLPIVDANNGVLTVSQNDNVELIDDIKAKTDLLKSGANVQFPYVSASGTITLFEGFDATSTGNAQIEVMESEPGEWDDDRIALGVFRFYMRHQKSDDDVDVEAELTTNGSAEHTLSADILSVDLPSRTGLYDWFFYATAPGTGSDEQGEFPIVFGTLELKRGKASSCP